MNDSTLQFNLEPKQAVSKSLLKLSWMLYVRQNYKFCINNKYQGDQLNVIDYPVTTLTM